MHPFWRERRGDGDGDDDGGFGGEAVGVTGWRWWRHGSGLWWRVVARELVGRIDPEMRIILGVGRKNSPENYSGGRRAAAAWWLAGGLGKTESCQELRFERYIQFAFRVPDVKTWISAIVSASSSSEFSWSKIKLKSGDLNSSRLNVLKCLLDDRNSHSGSLKGVNSSFDELLVMHYLKQGINNQYDLL
ncbi:hypothetical protein Tco_0438472 [Tanacetum coccineum]